MTDNNTYIHTYFRVEAGYNGGDGMTKEQTAAFFSECKERLTGLGFVFPEKKLSSGECPEGHRGMESLYCHPQSLSGYVIKEKIPEIEKALEVPKAKTFEFKTTDIYEEALNYSEEEFQEALKKCQPQMETDILTLCTTSRKNLCKSEAGIYSQIHSGLKFFKESKLKGLEYSFVCDLFAGLVDQGKLQKAKTTHGYGYRSLVKVPEKTASICGVSLKNLKRLRGDEGELITKGTIYIDGEKAGTYSESLTGGPMQFSVTPKIMNVLKERTEKYRKSHPYPEQFASVFAPDEVCFLISDLVNLTENLKRFKSIRRSDFGILAYKSEDGMRSEALDYAGSETEKNKNIAELKAMGFTEIYCSLDDFVIE